MTAKDQQFADAPPLLRSFLFYLLTIRGRSPRTVEAYYIDLRTFFRFLKQFRGLSGNAAAFEEVSIVDVDIALLRTVTLTDVYEFLNFTMTWRDNSAKTRARKVSSLRGFFRYLIVKEHLLEENPVKDLEIPATKKAMPKYLTLEESLELLTHVQSSHTQRDLCIITFLLNCGMRLSELVGINLEDIRDNTVKLLGKGNKERIIYLNDACAFALEQYLAARIPPEKGDDRNALFLSAQGRRMSARRVQQVVEDALKAAGLDGKGYSPHKLRHTAATLMYQHGGVDIRVLKEILGHANLATTELYTHVSNRQIEDAAGKSPLAGVKIRGKQG